MRFHTIVLSSGKTTTGIEVPAEIIEALGAGRRPKVRFTIAGHTFRSSVAPMNGTHMLGLNADVRQQTGVAAGDTIEIDLQADTEPREVTVPADFAAALDREPEARNTFDRLSYSNRRWHVLSIEGAKTDTTRQRRIDKSLSALAAGNIR